MPDARRTKPHVEVGERHPEETQPRPKHVSAIETAHAAIGFLAKRRSGEPVYAAANQMTKRVATKSVTAEQNHVHRQHHRSETDAEGGIARRRVGKPHRFPDIMAEENQKEQRHIQKVSVNVLHDERKGSLAAIRLARLAHGAGRRVGPERFVVSAAIVVTGQPEPARRPENEECRRKRQPRRPPARLPSEPTVGGISKKFRRRERRPGRPPGPLSRGGPSGGRAGEGGTFHRIGAANGSPLSLTLSPLLRRGERESTSGMVVSRCPIKPGGCKSQAQSGRVAVRTLAGPG